jgi:ribosomal protein L22
MRDDFGLMNIQPVKVALTAEDLELYNLPSDLDAKPSSPNYLKFIKKYGHKAVELDAMPVALLQKKLRDAIESVIDMAEFNAQIDLEKEDARIVEAYRRTVFEATGGSLQG